jgi:hypothetical protein
MSASFIALGGSLVMIPAAVAVFGYLIIGRAYRLALFWAVSFGVALMIVAASKLAFMGWGIQLRYVDFQGFSGHAMRSTAVIPTVLWLFMYNTPRGLRRLALAFGLLLGTLMAAAVALFDTHSASESIAGFMLGALVSLSFTARSQDMKLAPLRGSAQAVLVIGAAAIIIGLQGIAVYSADTVLGHIATALSGIAQPHKRAACAKTHHSDPAEGLGAAVITSGLRPE